MPCVNMEMVSMTISSSERIIIERKSKTRGFPMQRSEHFAYQIPFGLMENPYVDVKKTLVMYDKAHLDAANVLR
jgi:hypothetical protein